eukprot:SAG31_NODE_91_length_26366_cov_6.792211_3_plen_245_part_00
MNDDVKKLLRMMGCPCVDAPSEAEATCARLASAGKVDYAVTEDMDVLTFGTPKMLKNMFDTESSRTGTKRPVYEIDLAIVLEQLGVSMQQFVDFCILCGCDYLESIRGCGPATAFKLVVQHESIEGIAKALQQQPLARMQIPDNWEFAAARNFFLEPEVVDSNEVSVDLSEPDYEGLESWLVQEHQFNPERVTRSGTVQQRHTPRTTRVYVPLQSFVFFAESSCPHQVHRPAEKGTEKEKASPT